MKTIYVLMNNEEPVKAFADNWRAESYAAQFDEDEEENYYHIEEVDFDDTEEE